MSKYTPDTWVIIRIKVGDSKPLFKVVGGWHGNYLEGNNWRINSGITNISYNKDTNNYNIEGSSGSNYIVHKSAERVSEATRSILSRVLSENMVEIVSIEEAISSLK